MKTELCELAEKHGTDKCVFYTPFYDSLLKDRRNSVKKVLEFGIGSSEDLKDSLARVGLAPQKTGASLYMWRDYFPNAEIYALDHDSKKFINTDRITSWYCDQGDPESYKYAIEECIEGDFDLIVEDGSHQGIHQIISVKMLMPLLKDDGIYIMEDTGDGPSELLLSQIGYPYHVRYFSRPDLPNDRASVVVIRKK